MDRISPLSFSTFDDYAQWPSIGAALLARGYSRDHVAKLPGGNFRRVFAELAATSRRPPRGGRGGARSTSRRPPVH